VFQKTVLPAAFITLALVSTHHASGQDRPRTLIGVGGALQAANTAFRDNVTFILNEEDGDLNADYQVGIGRSLDGELELRVWRGLMAGVNVSYFEKQGRVNVDARLPHPIFFNRNRSLVGEAEGIGRTELGVHMLGAWLMPLTDRFDLLISGGPSFVRARQALVEQVDFTETAPFNSATFTGVSTTKMLEKSTFGMNAGAELALRLSRHFGVSTRVRFIRGSVTLDSPDSGTVPVDVGGVQLAGGLRVRF